MVINDKEVTYAYIIVTLLIYYEINQNTILDPNESSKFEI